MLRRSVFSLLTTAILLAACGSGNGSLFGKPDPTTNSSGGGTSDAGPETPLGTSTPDILAGCANETKKATPLPLDLILMLDTSGSMAVQVAQGVSKYKAVSNALASFVNDPSSAGIGIGLQFFPLQENGTPATCTTQAVCGTNGPCTYKACFQEGDTVWCDSAAQCASGATCVAVGRCANETASFCYVGQACGTDANGFDRGACVGQSSGVCGAADSCVDADYAIPKVPIAQLPGGATAITGALAAKSPDGSTPTSAALAGAITAATNYAKANPEHSVIAVLATDGLPTECTTSLASIAATAKSAYGGTPSIKTFVVGVFAANETVSAQSNLDFIASNGGTKKAFVVTQGATTTQQFIDAMTQIRGAALPCEYDVPVPTSGTPDFGKINVVYTPSSGNKSIYANRANAAACTATGGWYYDVDPNTGTPKKIALCPASCDAIQASVGQVEVVIGCVTQVN